MSSFSYSLNDCLHIKSVTKPFLNFIHEQLGFMMKDVLKKNWYKNLNLNSKKYTEVNKTINN